MDSQIRSQTQHGKMRQGLLAFYDMGKAQSRISPSDVVADFVGVVLHQFTPGIPFMSDNLPDHLVQTGENF